MSFFRASAAEGLLSMYLKTLRLQHLLLAIVWGVFASPAPGQEQVYEYGQIVQVDERGEALDFLDEEETEGVDRLPWIPVLSQTMICIDCWLGKTAKIYHHYSQQAAERFFEKAETCTDIELGSDSGCGEDLKYTLLAPFYAGCPSLLENGGFWGRFGRRTGYGVGSQYGFQEPIPSPVASGPQGTTLISPEPSEGMPLMPGETGPGSAPPMLEAPTEAGSASARARPTTQVASGSRWANMSDEEILAYFGLDSAAKHAQTAALVEELDLPVAPARNWEFADQSPAIPATSLMAQAPSPILEETAAPLDRPVVVEEDTTLVEATSLEELKETPTFEEKSFSVTDKEYEKMRQIEEDLLSDL